ncbi:MAG TPA: Fe-S cluster assembly protein SufD [Caulobacteraceae bacterium]|nr:Fe-S cluster assembly protein SufD [Caulobacteraceae bacterium]
MSLARAIETGDVAEVPSRRDEDWRWTDLAGLVRAIPPRSPEADAAILSDGPFADGADCEIVFLNGRSRQVGPVRVDAGERRTVALRFVSRATATAHLSELAIEVAPRGVLVLLESYEGEGRSYLADAQIAIRLGEGARIERIVIVDEAADAIAVSTAEVDLGARARFAQTVLSRGARRQRFETHIRHGEHAEVRLDGVYLLDGDRRADLTSEVLHGHPNAVTVQLTKGCVRDQARGVFQGRIIVARGADGADARMGHHALILSGRAEVDAKPELEIYADDVACSHGNTVGALDEETLFYMRQRGLPDGEARAVLTEAFVGEVVDRIEHEAARDVARAWVTAHLRVQA